MKAVVTTEFPGRPDNEPLSRTIKVGEIIAGDLAAVAVREGWAEEEGAEGGVEDESVSIDGMTVNQLKAYAAENNIDLGDASKKDDIRAAIALAMEDQN